MFRHPANLRIVVGAGGISDSGWIPTDIDTLDVLKLEDWLRLFRPASIKAILAEHVWEHLTLEQGRLALNYCHRFLRCGGYIRVAVPDGLHPDPRYIESVRVAGSGPGALDHKVLYNYHSLSDSMREAGFIVEALEYFDEAGHFHSSGWNPEAGKVRRSLRFDKRNIDGRPHYTSLILDGVKL